MRKTTIAATTWCRACDSTGDFFDGQDSYTCGTCGGSGEHPIDRTAYGVTGTATSDPVFYQPPVPRTAPDSRGLSVLLGLQNAGRHIYGGTVPQVEVARRRVKNKVARRSRRINRRTR